MVSKAPQKMYMTTGLNNQPCFAYVVSKKQPTHLKIAPKNTKIVVTAMMTMD